MMPRIRFFAKNNVFIDVLAISAFVLMMAMNSTAEATSSAQGGAALTEAPGAELIASANRMQKSVDELRTLVEAMPGPGLPLNPVIVVVPPPVYADPIDEIFARIGHLDQLVAEIANIFQAMPTIRREVAAEAPPKAAIQASPVAASDVVASEPDRPQHPFWGSISPVRMGFAAALVLLGIVLVTMRKLKRNRPLPTLPAGKKPANRAPVAKVAAAPPPVAVVQAAPAAAKPVAAKPNAVIEAPPLNDEALELADIMTSMGMADGAATALVQFISSNPKQALSHWIKLLEVYRHSGNKEKFEDAAQALRSQFNVQPGEWQAQAEQAAKGSLEDYPHISEQVQKLWPTPVCTDYLLGLLADNRGGQRAGFPLPVVEEILVLLAVLRAES